MARKLKDIELEEVSLVDKGANRKKFLFFKQEGKPTPAKKLKKKINIIIDSDGTIGGTKIAVNKDELKDLRDFSFSFWGSDRDTSNPVSCSYSKFVETEDGFSRSETFYLSKGDAQMNEKIKEQLQEYFGEEEKIDFEKAEDAAAVIGALETVNEYQEDFPDDLKKAVGIIAKQAGLYVPPEVEKQDNKAGVEKAGAKLSKETLGKLQDALKTLKSILPQLEEKTEKKSEVEKAIGELTKKIEQFETKENGDTKDGIVDVIKELTKRLEVVEKGTGVKKSIDGQDDDDDNDDNTGKKWSSLSGKKS